EGRRRHALELELLHHLELRAYLRPRAVYELHLRAQKAGRARPIRHSGKRCYVDSDHGHRILSSSASVRIAAFLLIWRAASISLDGAKAMTFTEHPRLLARVAGAFYLIITAYALFAYLYVRGQVIVPSDMAQTATNILAHERLYRLGFSAATIVVICNPPMGLILHELLKVVNPRLALLALVFITVSTTIEAINLFNYISPLFTFSLPEYRSAFQASELQALARGPIRMFDYAFSVSLTFFGVFSALIGFLILRSKFLPPILGILMMAAGVTYWIN